MVGVPDGWRRRFCKWAKCLNPTALALEPPQLGGCARSFARPSLVRSLVCSFVRSFVRSFIRSFVHSLARSFARSFVHSLARSFIRSLARSPVRSFARLYLKHPCKESPPSQIITRFPQEYTPPTPYMQIRVTGASCMQCMLTYVEQHTGLPLHFHCVYCLCLCVSACVCKPANWPSATGRCAGEWRGVQRGT